MNTTPRWCAEFGAKYNVPDWVMRPNVSDVSWHNDACPMFLRRGYRLSVEHPDPDLREVPCPRFAICRVDDNDQYLNVFLETEDENVARAAWEVCGEPDTHYEYRTTDPRHDTECLVHLSDWKTEQPTEFTVMRDGTVWAWIGANCATSATGDDDLFVKLLVDDEQSARLQTMPSIHRGWPDFKLIREDVARRYPDYQLFEGVDGEN